MTLAACLAAQSVEEARFAAKRLDGKRFHDRVAKASAATSRSGE